MCAEENDMLNSTLKVADLKLKLFCRNSKYSRAHELIKPVWDEQQEDENTGQDVVEGV